MKKRILTHQDLGTLAFVFVQNPHLTGIKNIAEGRSNEELIALINKCTTPLKQFTIAELVPFDAYPWESAKNDTSLDEQRANEFGITAAEFREKWNQVYQALYQTLHKAIKGEAK